MVLRARIDYAYIMYQKLNKKSILLRLVISASVFVLSSCSWIFTDDFGGDGGSVGRGFPVDFSNGGLALGAVVNGRGRPALKPFERWRYADQLASHILLANPELEGQVDSYEYVSRRVGQPFASLVQGYRLEGDLSSRAIEQFRQHQLRRKYLMMVTITPLDQEIPLTPDREEVAGNLNKEVQDYYEERYQTIRLASVRVQVYDTESAAKVADREFRSDDNGVALATERQSKKYVGNSILAKLSNIATDPNGEGKHPKAPSREVVLNYIWERVAESI